MEIFTDGTLPVLPNIKKYLSKEIFFLSGEESDALGA